MLVASVGLLRLPDVYCRMHAATKATTFGMGGILLGASIIFQSVTVTTQAFLAVFFLFLTAPVAAHLISRAAYRRGPDLCPETTHDEYGKYLEGRRAEEESSSGVGTHSKTSQIGTVEKVSMNEGLTRPMKKQEPLPP